MRADHTVPAFLLSHTKPGDGRNAFQHAMVFDKNRKTWSVRTIQKSGLESMNALFYGSSCFPGPVCIDG